MNLRNGALLGALAVLWLPATASADEVGWNAGKTLLTVLDRIHGTPDEIHVIATILPTQRVKVLATEDGYRRVEVMVGGEPRLGYTLEQPSFRVEPGKLQPRDLEPRGINMNVSDKIEVFDSHVARSLGTKRLLAPNETVRVLGKSSDGKAWIVEVPAGEGAVDKGFIPVGISGFSVFNYAPPRPAPERLYEALVRQHTGLDLGRANADRAK